MLDLLWIFKFHFGLQCMLKLCVYILCRMTLIRIWSRDSKLCLLWSNLVQVWRCRPRHWAHQVIVHAIKDWNEQIWRKQRRRCFEVPSNKRTSHLNIKKIQVPKTIFLNKTVNGSNELLKCWWNYLRKRKIKRWRISMQFSIFSRRLKPSKLWKRYVSKP